MTNEQIEQLQECVKDALKVELNFLNVGALDLITRRILNRIERECKQQRGDDE